MKGSRATMARSHAASLCGRRSGRSRSSSIGNIGHLAAGADRASGTGPLHRLRTLFSSPRGMVACNHHDRSRGEHLGKPARRRRLLSRDSHGHRGGSPHRRGLRIRYGFEVIEPRRPVELRFQILEGAIEGRFALHEVRFEAMEGTSAAYGGRARNAGPKRSSLRPQPTHPALAEPPLGWLHEALSKIHSALSRRTG